MRGVNGFGVGALSSEVPVTVGTAGCGAAPSAPQNLTQSLAAGVVTFAWTPAASGCAPTHYGISVGSGQGLADIGSADVGL